MAIYRTISLSFWSDTKIADEFTPEDKLFYLYLLTNTHTNLCGCYEVSFRQMAHEIGYTKDKIEKLVDRFINVHQAIDYSEATKEVLVINWHRYNWTKSPKFMKPLSVEINTVKEKIFKEYLCMLTENEEVRYGIDTKCIHTNCIDTCCTDTSCIDTSVTDTVTVTDTVSVTNTVSDIDNDYLNIIGYLNDKADRKYSHVTKKYRELINARKREGYTVDDFKKVVDNKVAEWKGDKDMEQYLRPNTLFSSEHFDEYLNQKIVKANVGGGKGVEELMNEVGLDKGDLFYDIR